MTTEQMIEEFIELGVQAYKKNSSGSVEAGKLNRHELVMIQGVEFSCWREYATFKMAEYVRSVLPASPIEVELNGNDSTIKIELTDSEQRELNRKLFLFLKRQGITLFEKE